MRPVMIFLLFVLLLPFYSCKKVIDLKLKESDIKYVVEGIITNEAGGCKVLVSQSKPFYEDNEFTKVSGAVVKVTDNGTEALLPETQPGTYTTTAIKGTPGHMYQLLVSINNQVFTATCTMPQPVAIDTLYVAPGPFGQFQFANIGYTDPAGRANWYRFVQYVNGVKDPAIFWENDEFDDGVPVLKQLDTGIDKKTDPRNINRGDQVTIELLCLDEAVYQYWYSLRTGGGAGSGNIATPANPITNIKGGALGYFSAQTVARRTVVAP